MAGFSANMRTCEHEVFAPVRVFARLRTGVCIATGSFGLPDLHCKPETHRQIILNICQLQLSDRSWARMDF